MAYHNNYGHCDSYFVVDDEMEFQRQAVRRQQMEIQARKHRLVQNNIAADMSIQDTHSYGDDILVWLHELELKALPDVFSIDMQTEIKWHMRPYLLEFLVEVHQSMNLLPETFFLAINILDRYCSRRVVFKKHYQLVGCTALLIASKYGEASKRVPHLKELRSMCCDQYEDDMFIQMERHVLTNLDWFVGGPTVDEFLNIAMNGCDPDSEVKNMALYISQMALMHRDFVSVKPSDLAKASLDLARIVTGKREQGQAQQAPWTFAYDPHVLQALSAILQTPSKILKNVFRHHNVDCVSLILDDFLLRLQQQAEHAAAPGTPPRQPNTMAEELCQDTMQPAQYYNTPQKNPYGPTMMITPPLTPEGEQFQAAQQKVYCTQMTLPSIQVSAPPTPTPESAAYYHGSAYLPPMQPAIPHHYYDQNMIM